MTNLFNLRIGEGWDIHALVKNRPLILGGILIPNNLGLWGHSDADVLLHSITDALLGASSLGDIGQNFPDSDLKYKNANSMDLLIKTVEKIKKENWQIINIDSTIIAQKPKLAPYILSMRENIAKNLNLKLQQINIKAKTSESFDSTGQNLSMQARAVVLLITNKT